jgi:hypothetical protein
MRMGTPIFAEFARPTTQSLERRNGIEQWQGLG